MRARAIQMIPLIRKNVDVFMEVVAKKCYDSRAGNQIGTLLAGAWCLENDSVASPEVAKEFSERHDWTDSGIEVEFDEMKVFNIIVQSLVPIIEDSKTVVRTVLQLVGLAFGRTDFDLSAPDELFPSIRISKGAANDTLMKYGMKVVDNIFFICTGSQHVEKMLVGTPYKDNWSKLIQRIVGAGVSCCRIDGRSQRAIAIPMSVIFEDEEK
jgi:putative DNA primase/helicase